jgi:hypothetical protein
LSTASPLSTAPPSSGLPPEAAAAQLVMQIGSGHLLASALQVVASLRIPDRLAGGARTAAELAADAGVREDGLYRVLRALASVGLFDEEAPRRFKLTLAGQMLRSDVPGSMHPMALWITSPFHFRVYADLMHSVRTGQPAAEKVTGVPVFEHFARDRELSEVFNDAMTAFSEVAIAAVLEAYDFSGIGLLVDVAGGHGAVLGTVLERYPAMRGILFDLDHVVAGAGPRLEARGVAGRCQTRHGDFFQSVPQGGDAYIMKHIIHDWDDERALVILRNIHRAMGDKSGRVILLESVIPPGNQAHFGKIIDLEMMVMPGGKERTEEEFRSLFSRAGFELTRVVPTESPLSVVEARRAG